ncbi:MAG: amidase family protein [Pseudomonadota bacterium]
MSLLLRSFIGFAAGISLVVSNLLVAEEKLPSFVVEEASIADIQKAVDDGVLTYEALVRMYLARIAVYEDGGPKINSIITLNPDAIKTAAMLDQERKTKGKRSALHGIPVLLKDNVNTVDMPTTNGSVILKNAMPPNDAFITQQLRAAGAVILGKAAMGEFAGGSYNSVTGQTLNPYHFKRHTGGSSSGSGAAIAANFAVLAVGTDTSTSVRGPSAYNGIVGLRPTTGLISRNGIAPKNLNFDSAGPMARTLTDMVKMLNVLAAPDVGDPLNLQVWNEYKKVHPDFFSKNKNTVDYSQFLHADALQGVRLGVVRDFFGGDPEIDALAETALKKMQAMGATLVNITLDKEFVDAYLDVGGKNIRKLSDYRFKADWEKYLATFNGKVPKTVAEFVKIYETDVKKSAFPVEGSVMNLLKTSLTTSTDDPAYKDLIDNILPNATKAKLQIFKKYNVEALVFPYFSNFAPPIKNPAFAIEDPTFVESKKMQPAILGGYSSVGFPSLVVPMGFGSQGLPMDITFFGKPYDEGKLIGFGFAYEQATKLRKPSPLLPPLPIN